MPTVLRVDGLRFVIYPNDHRPAHIHVIGGGCEAVFFLNAPSGPPELRENYGFTLKALQKVERRLAQNLASLTVEWRKIHGGP
jgi:hypothetical protein